MKGKLEIDPLVFCTWVDHDYSYSSGYYSDEYTFPSNHETRTSLMIFCMFLSYSLIQRCYKNELNMNYKGMKIRSRTYDITQYIQVTALFQKLSLSESYTSELN